MHTLPQLHKPPASLRRLFLLLLPLLLCLLRLLLPLLFLLRLLLLLLLLWPWRVSVPHTHASTLACPIPHAHTPRTPGTPRDPLCNPPTTPTPTPACRMPLLPHM
jgi:hypothetical protein